MSPLARSLLALAAAALMHAACATQCTTAVGGKHGSFGMVVPGFHLDQTDSANKLPPQQCGPLAIQVGVVVTVCDPYGVAPEVELDDDNRHIHITCVSTDGELCPQGIDVSTIEQRCRHA